MCLLMHWVHPQVQGDRLSLGVGGPPPEGAAPEGTAPKLGALQLRSHSAQLVAVS